MKDFNYLELASRTVSAGWNKAVPTDVIHAVMGMSTEAAELLDDVKKSLFYNKPLDRGHLVEEMGDVLWYLALLMNTLGVTFEEVQRLNIDKLRKRYPKGFTDIAAVKRNIPEEIKIFRSTEGDYSGG